MASSGQMGARGQLAQDAAGWSYRTQGWESTPETARMSLGLASTLKFRTWEMQGTHS